MNEIERSKNKIERSKKILRRKEDVLEFLGVGEALLDFFVQRGLPVAIINGKWFAHTDNLEEYFRVITRSGFVLVEKKKKELE